VVGAFAGALVTGYAFLAWADVDPNAVAAVAGAVAAGAAWRAASESSATARDAREALGLATKPTLDAGVGGDVHADDGSGNTRRYANAWVANRSVWPAADVDVEVRMRDGRVLRRHFDRLDGKDRPSGFLDTPSPSVGIECGPPIPDDHVGTDLITVAFSDERRQLRWEITRSVARMQETRTDGSTTTRQATDGSERRLR
jgi:hypothetical protein